MTQISAQIVSVLRQTPHVIGRVFYRSQNWLAGLLLVIAVLATGTPTAGNRLLSKPYRKDELRRAVRDAIDEVTR